MTNDQGVVQFDTIYPGWYRGRATHIHVKVHVDAHLTNVNGTWRTKGGHVSHTGQLFFDDTITDEVNHLPLYTSQTFRRTRNYEDETYVQSQGSTTLISMEYLTENGVRGPMRGEITLGVDPSLLWTPLKRYNSKMIKWWSTN